MTSENQPTTEFAVHRRILFGDCDPGGIVYTPRVSDFIVEATLDFLAYKLRGPAVRRIIEMGILPPARALAIEFLSPMAWDDELRIQVRVKEVGVHSFTFSIEARKSTGEPAFTAQLTQVCISPETRRPVAIPEELRSVLTTP